MNTIILASGEVLNNVAIDSIRTTFVEDEEVTIGFYHETLVEQMPDGTWKEVPEDLQDWYMGEVCEYGNEFLYSYPD